MSTIRIGGMFGAISRLPRPAHPNCSGVCSDASGTTWPPDVRYVAMVESNDDELSLRSCRRATPRLTLEMSRSTMAAAMAAAIQRGTASLLAARGRSGIGSGNGSPTVEWFNRSHRAVGGAIGETVKPSRPTVSSYSRSCSCWSGQFGNDSATRNISRSSNAPIAYPSMRSLISWQRLLVESNFMVALVLTRFPGQKYQQGWQRSDSSSRRHLSPLLRFGPLQRIVPMLARTPVCSI